MGSRCGQGARGCIQIVFLPGLACRWPLRLGSFDGSPRWTVLIAEQGQSDWRSIGLPSILDVLGIEVKEPLQVICCFGSVYVVPCDLLACFHTKMRCFVTCILGLHVREATCVKSKHAQTSQKIHHSVDQCYSR